ncbi:hypothetical protein [Paenibacillus sp. CECT 9249]|uniref:hypothetical protein n=1 Tax=Paenibacillus sp. CECT 9249 TaxID=2845385 RepID=UPI001E3B7214|nr:hypothetical protein [Paenibacillus sp. CECT 9249]
MRISWEEKETIRDEVQTMNGGEHRMKNKWRTIAAGTLALWIASLATAGCTLFSPQPEKLFSMALSGLSGVDDFTFSGNVKSLSGHSSAPLQHLEFEGVVRNHKQIAVRGQGINSKQTNVSERWNPLVQMEAIHASRKTVSLLEDQSGRGFAVLEIVLNPEDAKELLGRQLRDEMDKLSAPLLQTSSRPVLSAAETKRLRSELADVVNQGRNQLEQMLKDAQVDTTYTLWIHRKTNLPHRLVSVTASRYKAEGTDRREELITDAYFKNYR